MNRKTTVAVAAAALATVLAACSGTATDDETTAAAGGEESRTLRVGSTGQSYPNSFQEDGELIGFDVEVIETAAANLGWDVEWTNTDFAGLMGQLEAGRLDTVANAVAITEERSEIYDFTEPYAYYGAQIVTNEANDDINELEDLAGRTVAGVLGSNNTAHLERWAEESGTGVEVRTYETRDGATQDVINNRVDGYINSRPVLLAEIERTDAPLKMVGDPIAYEGVGFPLAKTDEGAELHAALTEQVGVLREDGTLAELSEKYFGEDITSEPAELTEQ
ncbi:transporter substrate-binding domain-containing protein [Georgenia subflava]|uniref:Transporter substrate-binding domain-containing protein n=1 Tax=Georgenia subflava TaxID=1622177 RepID=A0A6N7ERF0_9MICO|nr:transporter substrate-binding domain-containing protein [Georgenia subflava]MPV39115.1 transporter substrate-binding domain-containing protein [Georgenia subflava]